MSADGMPDREEPSAPPGDAPQARLIAGLSRVLASASGEPVRVEQTHISSVLLTGRHAYKIKKPVDLGFLDFRTLASRKFYCEQELRLNRRLAPALYLDVVPITGTPDAPVLGGTGPPIEYALRMQEFPQDALASRAIARGDLTAGHIDALAMRIAAFHREAPVARPDGPFGSSEMVQEFAMRNFARIRPVLSAPGDIDALDALCGWTRREHARIAPFLLSRREAGRVRECHGDLHLNNIALIGGEPVVFDCIEFSEELRCIDVMSDVAFLAMDLADRGRPDLGHRFVNAYLEITGDYDGTRVLRFYLVYRAMVRAMVACERARQVTDESARAGLVREYHGYAALASAFASADAAALLVTHGFSGSGKTTLTQDLLESIGAVRIRTDVERKRLHGMRPADRSTEGLSASLYRAEATRWVYLRVLALARGVAGAGIRTIVDGAFLRRWQRELFRDLAAELAIPFVVVDFVADEATLRARIGRRQQDARDASDADLQVLEAQLRTHEPLADTERADTITVDARRSLAPPLAAGRWQAVVDRLERPDAGAGAIDSRSEASR